MSTLYEAARDHRALDYTGKYQIITLKRGYGIRNILDGYIEFKCRTRREAENILRKLITP